MLRRVAAGLGLSGLILLVTMIGQVLAVPILLSSWGTQLYGEWLTLTNLVSSLTVFNLGVQSYAMNLLIACYVDNDIEKGSRIVHAALRLYTVLCSVILLIAIGLAAWPGLTTFLNISILSSFQARWIVLLQGTLTAYAIFEGALMSLLIAIQQYPRRLKYSLAERVAFLGLPLLVACLGKGPVWAISAIALFMAGIAFVQFRDLRRHSPFSLGIRLASWGDAWGLIGPSLVFLAVTLAGQVLATGMTVLVSASLGAAAVAVYATMLMMTNFVRTVINQGLNILWPEVTAANAQNDDSTRLARWHHLLLKLIGVLVLLAALGLLLFAQDIMALWSRGKIEWDGWLNLLLTLYLVVQSPALVSRVFGLATNHQGELFKIDLAVAILTVVLAFSLAGWLGLRGVALALLVVQGFGTVWMERAAIRWTRDSVAGFVGQFIRSFPVWMVFAGLVMMSRLTAFWPLPAQGMWFLLGLASLGALTWFVWFNEDERAGARTKFREISRRQFAYEQSK